MVPADPKALVVENDLPVVTRKARHDDAARIAVLATQVWLHTYATEGISAAIADYTRTDLIPEKFLAIQKDSTSLLWVAERGGCLIGFAVLKWGAVCPVSSLTLAELQTLYVQAHFVGKGVGRQLLSVAEKEAVDKAGMPLWLSVNASNVKAIGFYMRHGYTKQGVTDFVLGQKRHENWIMIGCRPPCT